MRSLTIAINALAILLVIGGLGLVATSFEHAIQATHSEPEDVWILAALTLLLILSGIVSAINIAEAKGGERRRYVFVGNAAIIVPLVALLCGTVILRNPDWPIWLLWLVPYSAHLWARSSSS